MFLKAKLSILLKFLIKFFEGFISRKLPFNHLKKLLKANEITEIIKKHYENYPEKIT
jgi:hypothetical protein